MSFKCYLNLTCQQDVSICALGFEVRRELVFDFPRFRPSSNQAAHFDRPKLCDERWLLVTKNENLRRKRV